MLSFCHDHHDHDYCMTTSCILSAWLMSPTAALSSTLPLSKQVLCMFTWCRTQSHSAASTVITGLLAEERVQLCLPPVCAHDCRHVWRLMLDILHGCCALKCLTCCRLEAANMFRGCCQSSLRNWCCGVTCKNDAMQTCVPDRGALSEFQDIVECSPGLASIRLPGHM